MIRRACDVMADVLANGAKRLAFGIGSNRLDDAEWRRRRRRRFVALMINDVFFCAEFLAFFSRLLAMLPR